MPAGLQSAKLDQAPVSLKIAEMSCASLAWGTAPNDLRAQARPTSQDHQGMWQVLTKAMGLFAEDGSSRNFLPALVISASRGRLSKAWIAHGRMHCPRWIMSSAIMRGNLAAKSSEMTVGLILLTSRSTACLQYLETCAHLQICEKSLM